MVDDGREGPPTAKSAETLVRSTLKLALDAQGQGFRIEVASELLTVDGDGLYLLRLLAD